MGNFGIFGIYEVKQFQMLKNQNFTSRLQFALIAYVIASIILIIATWLPHYLIWPTVCDWDMPAKAALWDINGLVPYRDFSYGVTGPGQIYIWKAAFILGGRDYGKVFANLIDASLMISLGFFAVKWSNRHFQTKIPGLIIFLGWTARYAGYHFGHSAQRDWHCIYFIVLALMVMQSRNNKSGFALSGILFSISAFFRPYFIFTIPVFLIALIIRQMYNENNAKLILKKSVVSVVLWGLIVISSYFAINLLFLPLDALVIHLKSLAAFLQGGGYSENPMTISRILLNYSRYLFFGYYLTIPLTLFITLYQLNKKELYFLVVPWIVLAFTTIFWMASYPDQDYGSYVQIPNSLLNIIMIGTFLGLLFVNTKITPDIKLGFACLCVLAVYQTRPAYSSIGDAINAVKLLAAGKTTYFPNCQREIMERYIGSETQYLEIVDKLRTLPDDIRIFNALIGKPPSFTADSGLMDANPSCAFTVESYYGTLKIANKSDVIHEVESLKDRVVAIWTPNNLILSPDQKKYNDPLSTEKKDQLQRMTELRSYINQSFIPEELFGEIAIYKRIP